jgi:hypothetical protein
MTKNVSYEPVVLIIFTIDGNDGRRCGFRRQIVAGEKMGPSTFLRSRTEEIQHGEDGGYSYGKVCLCSVGRNHGYLL